MNEIGEMVEGCWLDLSRHYPMIDLDEFIIMPNHIHGIIIITDEPVRPSVVVDQPEAGVGATLVVDQSGAGTRPAPTNPTLGDMMMAFKSITTHEYIIGVKQSGWPPFEKRIWQRNYYEHIIRSEEELLRVRDYINGNPLRWDLDEENLQKG